MATVNVNTSNNTVTVSSGVTTVVQTSTKGPKGDRGLQGLQGIAGPTGSIGPQGIAGPTGSVGIQGSVGPTGPAGIQGIAGPTGSIGLQGIPGPSGSIGPQGVAGPTGSIGPQGVPGIANTGSLFVSASVTGSTISLEKGDGTIVDLTVDTGSNIVSWNNLLDIPQNLVSSSIQVDYNSISNTPTTLLSSSQQITNFGFISSSQTIETGSFATTGSNTFVGNQIVSGTLNIATNSGDEGGEIQLGKALTNTTIAGNNVIVDVFRDRVRIFEDSGSTRGAFLNIVSQSAGVSSQIVTSPNIFSIQTISSASYAALNPPISGTLYIIV